MYKLKLILSISIFSSLLIFTSAIKNQTREIEKEIKKIDRQIAGDKKDLYETELDYSYLSSPLNLSKKIKELALIDYIPMDFSRIYMSYKDFNEAQKKMTILKTKNEKTKKKN